MHSVSKRCRSVRFLYVILTALYGHHRCHLQLLLYFFLILYSLVLFFYYHLFQISHGLIDFLCYFWNVKLMNYYFIMLEKNFLSFRYLYIIIDPSSLILHFHVNFTHYLVKLRWEIDELGPHLLNFFDQMFTLY